MSQNNHAFHWFRQKQHQNQPWQVLTPDLLCDAFCLLFFARDALGLGIRTHIYIYLYLYLYLYLYIHICTYVCPYMAQVDDVKGILHHIYIIIYHICDLNAPYIYIYIYMHT